LREGHLSGFSAKVGERFLGGKKVREFEANLAEFFDVKHAITFNSATSALHSCIAAAKVGPGDEVITSPYTMSATAASIIMTNGIPVFSDIEDKTYGLDPESVRKKITPLTKAILTVNIFGHPSNLYELKQIADENNLLLIEDNSQAPNVKYKNTKCGKVGEMAVLSLNYHKAIQTGEGGVVITDNDHHAEFLRLIRNHSESTVSDFGREDITNLVGWNYRLTEIQAAIGIEQLKKLEDLSNIRFELASYLKNKLKQFNFITPPTIEENCGHGFYLFAMRFNASVAGISRNTFAKAVAAEGVSISEGYVKPIYLEPMFQKKIAYGNSGCPFKCPLYKGKLNYNEGSCPITERMHFSEILTTDICKFPNTKKDIDEFVEAIKKVIDNKDSISVQL